MSANLDRFKHRILEAEKMTANQKSLTEFHNQIREWEREKVYNAIAECWNWSLFNDDLTADDFIQQVKLNLRVKDVVI
jgi:hypothetical protein